MKYRILTIALLFILWWSLIWLHHRLKLVEAQIAEIHALATALVEWEGGRIER